jgi:arrestin-related trafficking adapter 3/6
MNRNSATLRLTEPVIFLRNGSDSSSGRRRVGGADCPPALLRGLLTLKLVKPTRVKSIEVLLEGISKTDWPDGTPFTAQRHLFYSRLLD